jgi:hypothetical protein
MGNSHLIESLLQHLIQTCTRLTEANRLLLPTAEVLVTYLWLQMRPAYRLVKESLGTNAEACSAEFNRWWANGGAPETLVVYDRRTGV